MTRKFSDGSQIKHFMCDCGYSWHGMEIYIERDVEEPFPVIATIINEDLGWKNKLRAIWHILRGTTHIMHEVYISRGEVDDFVDFVCTIKHDPNTQ